MTHSRSYTSATPNVSAATTNLPARDPAQNMVSQASTNWWRTGWFAIFLLGASLRVLRLSWQPLWWDEGYSIFFATEPLPTMFSLTAQDIHPPFYYALLHAWFALFGASAPEVARLLSVLIGVATLPTMTWASLTLLPKRRWLALLATLFLAISPIHIFYSQEVRMYGLALFLTLAATTLLWRMERQVALGDKPYGLTWAYVITASLALLTLYYVGFLLLAHQLWTFARHRHNLRRLLWFLVAAVLILLIQLPWWLYALPRLFAYVADKVLADQDVSLPLWSYLWRHGLAFTTGHLPAAQPWLEVARQAIAALIALTVLIAALLSRWRDNGHAVRSLLSFVLIPIAVGFGVNLVYPFFPEGGERLLLQVLPYLLLLITLVIGNTIPTRPRLAALLIALPLVASIIGALIFFTAPRYAQHDYRPIIADVIQQARSNDSVLALFPWQVGYWRAYAPRTAAGALLSPQPAPVDQTILRWNEEFAARLDAELGSGTVWFPMPVSLGSILPFEIETYLIAHARNLENHWYSPATRLTAWVKLAATAPQQSIGAIYSDQLQLVSGSVAPPTVTSANTPLAIDLCWQPPDQRDDLSATLRLLDASGYTWAKRDLTPLAAFAKRTGDNACFEAIAMNIPVGLPPNSYQLVVGVGPKESEQLFMPTAALTPLTPIAQIAITAPNETISPYRLPIEHLFVTPTGDNGLLLLGYTGPNAGAELLAGDELALTLFLQNSVAQPPSRDLFVSLLDRQGNVVAGWQGWPLPTYPSNTWSQGALAQAPIHFYLPPNLTAGDFTLIAGFVDPATSTKSTPAILNHVQVIRRPTTFTPPLTQSEITPSPLFGTHATLLGYSATIEGTTLHLELTWQIAQTLLPPHAIFVHLFDATGQRIAQSDGDPITAEGRAPTGSWLPSEYLTTQHSLTLPTHAQPPFTLQTGLYLPATGARLPVTVKGTTVGDSVTISLPIAP